MASDRQEMVALAADLAAPVFERMQWEYARCGVPGAAELRETVDHLVSMVLDHEMQPDGEGFDRVSCSSGRFVVTREVGYGWDDVTVALSLSEMWSEVES